MEKNKTSVLVIENHPMMRASLCAAIATEADLEVAEPAPEKANGFQLKVSNQHDVLFLATKPDIILMALGNPGLDDLQALSSLSKRLRGTPILVLTSSEVPGQEQAALEHGAQAVLTKAVSREELLEAIRSVKSSISHIL